MLKLYKTLSQKSFPVNLENIEKQPTEVLYDKRCSGTSFPTEYLRWLLLNIWEYQFCKTFSNRRCEPTFKESQ